MRIGEEGRFGFLKSPSFGEKSKLFDLNSKYLKKQLQSTTTSYCNIGKMERENGSRSYRGLPLVR
jgi:hypothetical protein